MKKVFWFLVLASANVYATEARKDPFKDQDLACVVTSDYKRYDDIFVIQVREKEHSRIGYRRIHLASPKDANGNPTYGGVEPIRGCQQGIQVKDDQRPQDIIIECKNGGQEGIVTIRPGLDEKNLMGDIYFYYPQIGYPERTLLEVSCTRP